MGKNNIASMTVMLKANANGLNKGLSGAKAKMSAFQKGANMLKATLLPIFGIGAGMSIMRNAVGTIAEFEQAMADVKSITKPTAGEFDGLRESAKRLGRETKFTNTEVAQLQKELGKLGFTTGEIIKAQDAILNLAAATNSELSVAAESVGITIRQFSLDASEAQRVTDVMARSFTSSALDMTKFSEAMTYVGPVANAAGISLERTTAMLAALADAGISGSMAGTSLRMIINKLTTDSKPLKEKLKQLSDEGLSFSEANEEVGRRAQSALLVLNKPLMLM